MNEYPGTKTEDPSRPPLSYDQNITNELLFPNPVEAIFEFCLESVMWIQRRGHLKMLTDGDGQATKGHYILSLLCAFGSGELKQQIHTNTYKYDDWKDENIRNKGRKLEIS